MRSIVRLAGAGVALCLSLSHCAGGGSSSAPHPAIAPVAGAPASTTVSPLFYGAEITQGAALIGRASLGTVSLNVAVKMRDEAGLAQYASTVSMPTSGNYQQFLTPEQVADRFGATPADYATVSAYLTAHGLAVHAWKQRQFITVSGTQAQVESALGTTFSMYSKNGHTFYAPVATPAALAGLPVRGIADATNYTVPTASHIVRNGLLLPNEVGYSPQQLARAFDFSGAYNASYTGHGITIGIIGTGPISAPDLVAYKTLFNATGVAPVTQVNVTDTGTGSTPGTFATPPPATGPCTIPAAGPSAACNPEDGEAQLDTQQIASLAPGANVLFYLAYEPNGGGAGVHLEGISLYKLEVAQALNDNVADILSLSIGEGEQDDVGDDFQSNGTGIAPQLFQTAAAQGIAVMVASGDWGALECLPNGGPGPGQPFENQLCVSYPGSDPNVVSVGGVTTPLDNAGRLIAPITGWGLQTGGGAFQSASGGGTSKYFALPAYQNGVSGITTSFRNTPDVSLEADGVTGVDVVENAAFGAPQFGAFAGTSIAAPEMAAMWSLVLQACAATPACQKGPAGHAYRLGLPNPQLYKIYASPLYGQTFYDVVFGNNSQLPACASIPGSGSTPVDPASPCPTASPVAGFQAGVGYDLVTGIGVPFARSLIKAVVGV